MSSVGKIDILLVHLARDRVEVEGHCYSFQTFSPSEIPNLYKVDKVAPEAPTRDIFNHCEGCGRHLGTPRADLPRSALVFGLRWLRGRCTERRQGSRATPWLLTGEGDSPLTHPSPAVLLTGRALAQDGRLF